MVKKLVIFLCLIGIAGVIWAGNPSNYAPRPHVDQGLYDQRLPRQLVMVGDANKVVFYSLDPNSEWKWWSMRAADTIVTDANYIWPDEPNDPNYVLYIKSVSGNEITLDWGSLDGADPNWILPIKTPWNVMYVGSDGYPLTEDPNYFTYYQPEQAFGVGIENIAEGLYANNYIQVYTLLDFDPNLLNVTIGRGSDDTQTGPNNVTIGNAAGNILSSGYQDTLGGKDSGLYLKTTHDNTGWGYKTIGGAADYDPNGEGESGFPTLPSGNTYSGLTHTTPISDIEDLNDIRDDLTGNYYLTGDIDASDTSTWDGGEGFPTINGSFTGTLDGCGYKITNLYMHHTVDNGFTETALFDTLNGATVANLIIEDATIYSSYSQLQRTATLAGQVLADSTIANVIVRDTTVTASQLTSPNVGMFAAYISDSNITDCFCRGILTNWNGYDGGFAQQIVDANLLRVGVEGTSTFTSNQWGGAPGHSGFVNLTTNTYYEYCYANVDIINSFNNLGGKNTGGFYGRDASDCNFVCCYAAGDIEQPGASGYTFPLQPTGGGFLGAYPGAGDDPCFVSCYWYIDKTGTIYSGGGEWEVHQLRIDGTPSGGSYTITFDGTTTASISHNATQSVIQAACDAAFGTSTINIQVVLPVGWQNGNDIIVHYNSTAYDMEDLADNITSVDISNLTGASNFRVVVYNDGVAPYQPAGLNGIYYDQQTPDQICPTWIYTGEPNQVTALGSYAAARVSGGADRGLYVGAYSGAHNVNDPNYFFLDNLDRTTYLAEQGHGMMWGYFADDPNNQWLNINADVNMPLGLDVNEIEITVMTNHVGWDANSIIFTDANSAISDDSTDPNFYYIDANDTLFVENIEVTDVNVLGTLDVNSVGDFYMGDANEGGILYLGDDSRVVTDVNWTLEDFTTYTESDPEGRITVASHTITGTDFETRNLDNYIYKDKGAAYFSGDFSHRVKFRCTGLDFTTGWITFWQLANEIGTTQDLVVGAEDGVALYFSEGSPDITLTIYENGAVGDSDSYVAAFNTYYYCTIARDDDAGANSTGQYTAYICTGNYNGETDSVLVDTLTVDSAVGEQNDFQYVYALANYNSGSTGRDGWCTVENLTLSETYSGRLEYDQDTYTLYVNNLEVTDKAQATEFITTGWPSSPGVTLSYDNGTRTLTVTDGGSAYYYINGVKYTLGGNKTVSHADTEGVWFFYFNGSTLTASQTPWVILDNDKALVGYIYWDATNNEHIVLGYEFHTYLMDAATHSRFHNAGGSSWDTGLLVSDAGSETVNVSAGDFYDEDIEIAITDSAGGSLWEQVLSPAELPVYYRDGASNWRIFETADKGNATDVGYVDGSNDLKYNKLNGTWATATVTTNKYVAYYAIATNDTTEPVALIMGQRVDNTLADAKENNVFSGLTLTGLPTQEMIVLARLLLKDTGAGVYYELDEVIDLRVTNLTGNVTSPLFTDHGGLGGLADDDHTQYLLADGTRALTASWSAGQIVQLPRLELDAATEYIDTDGGGNLTFTDTITGTKTLAQLGSPTRLYLKATGQSEGDLHLSDGTNWPTSTSFIAMVRVITSSTDWDLYLLQNDNGFATDDAVIPKLMIANGIEGNANLKVDVPYDDEDDSNEIHLYYLDNSGTNTATIIIIGYSLN